MERAPAGQTDRWSRWHSVRDEGGAFDRSTLSVRLEEARDSILNAIEPLDGVTLLDIGTGDGLIGLGALDLVGPTGTVIFSDISEALLERCRESVVSQGAADRARFVATRVEDLAGVEDSSVDVVTGRAVLVFVTDKALAFAAMHRVLRQGGRISLREVVGRLMFPEPAERFWGYDLTPVRELCVRVKVAYTQLEDPDYRRSMLNFDDRDLVDLAYDAGFDRVHAECRTDITPGPLLPCTSLEGLLSSAPTPVSPTIGGAVESALDCSERKRFLATLEDAIRTNRASSRTVVAHIVAHKRL
jgi:arsenite methyltransferase